MELKTLNRLIGAANTEAQIGNWKGAVPLLQQAEMMAADMGLHDVSADLFNLYIRTKIKAYG